MQNKEAKFSKLKYFSIVTTNCFFSSYNICSILNKLLFFIFWEVFVTFKTILLLFFFFFFRKILISFTSFFSILPHFTPFKIFFFKICFYRSYLHFVSFLHNIKRPSMWWVWSLWNFWVKKRVTFWYKDKILEGIIQIFWGYFTVGRGIKQIVKKNPLKEVTFRFSEIKFQI